MLMPALNAAQSVQVLMLNQTSGVTYKRCTPPVVRASAQGDAVVLCKQGRTARREFLEVLGILTASAILTDTALAEKTPKGYQAVLDKFDGYTFLYPFGWQEVVVNGQDKTYKDVIEPLESVSVSIVPTSKTDIHELGPPEEVAETLIKKVLSSSTQKTKLVNVKERTAEGRNYYTFEFVAKAPNYTRHALGTVAIGNGKFYTLTTGANERRWGKMEDKLRTIAESLTLFKV
ncbi:psbP-like protein 1, chloroplastic isoform X2 [Cryptomeria japonica]|uniref:psbP-like protein 1, chloroplastic isoform X2 n=1 Tax=Cryptomeria japonica TaxID=3369 RepID=UPI0025AD6370|nr:psbP-like protein 1, chloroplastic isoform X2 [Cryptomeria japonica]